MMSHTGADLVRTLAGWLAGTGITLLELQTADEKVRLVQNGNAVPARLDPAPEATSSIVVISPGAGVFRDRHPLRTEALAPVGQAVRAGDVVGLLQAGLLLLHVVAPADGIVVEAAVPAGGTVGYGAALLRLEPEDAG